MREPSHPLDQPLPSDVAAGESAFIQFYQKYVVFSWSWAWRRTVVFGALAVFAGALFGASHGLHVRVVWEALVVTLVCSTANLVLVGAGPMLAAFVRHRAWPLKIERSLIVASVIAAWCSASSWMTGPTACTTGSWPPMARCSTLRTHKPLTCIPS
jgi:hypothetical protein